MATVSHLPHVIANVMVSQAEVAISDEGERLPEVGGAFATRLASPAPIRRSGRTSSPATPTRSPPRSSGRSERLREAAELIRAGDAHAVEEWQARARGARDRLLEAGASGGTLTELRVTVENKPGVVAEIALALGRAGVNIEDMALQPAAGHAHGRDLALGGRRWRRGSGGRGDAGDGAYRERRRVQRVTSRTFEPSGPLKGSLTPPPDKSISHRAALLAAMADGTSRISGYLDSADTRSTLAAIEALGADVVSSPGPHDSLDVSVTGIGLRGPAQNAGSAPVCDRRRERRHADAASSRVARRPAGRRLGAGRRRVHPAQARGSDRRSPAARWGPTCAAREGRLPPLEIRGIRARRHRVRRCRSRARR